MPAVLHACGKDFEEWYDHQSVSPASSERSRFRARDMIMITITITITIIMIMIMITIVIMDENESRRSSGFGELENCHYHYHCHCHVAVGSRKTLCYVTLRSPSSPFGCLISISGTAFSDSPVANTSTGVLPNLRADTPRSKSISSSANVRPASSGTR